jgi:hypothetical protein
MGLRRRALPFTQAPRRSGSALPAASSSGRATAFAVGSLSADPNGAPAGAVVRVACSPVAPVRSPSAVVQSSPAQRGDERQVRHFLFFVSKKTFTHICSRIKFDNLFEGFEYLIIFCFKIFDKIFCA